MNSITLFSVPISVTDKDGALAVITHWLKDIKRSKRGSNWIKKTVVTPNPEIIVAAQKDKQLLAALQAADLSIADGIGVVWALRILNTEYQIPNKESNSPHSKFSIQNSVFFLSRLSGLDLMESLIALAACHGWRVMLLGGKPGVAEKAAEKLRQTVKRSNGQTVKKFSAVQPFSRSAVLDIVALSGPQDIARATSQELDQLITTINHIKPDILFVAFGHGKQEKWLIANRKRLTVGVAMVVGGAFDQIADPTLRPPRLVDRAGLGWLYRLIREPWRWRRQIALISFVGMIVKERLHRLTG